MSSSVGHDFVLAFAHCASDLWKVVADTQRINEASGSPKYDVYEIARDDGSVDVYGRLSVAGRDIEWLELPVNWIENRWFEQVRRFSNGPLLELSGRFQIDEQGSGCRCTISLGATPRNWVGRLVCAHILRKFEGNLRRLVETAERSFDPAQPIRYETRPRIPASARARAGQLAGQIEQTPYGHGLARRLADYVLCAQEVDLWTIRPLALARDWNTGERPMVELFLQAVKVGLLESRWDLLCPRCRISKSQALQMEDLPQGVHCPACNIDYQADFSRNVELAFSPGPAIRPVEYGHFCRSSPAATPHVKGQITLQPGEHKRVPARLEPGDYRVRTLEAGGDAEIRLEGSRFPLVRVCDETVALGEPAADFELQLSNEGTMRRTVIVEDRSWRRDVLTAERVTTLQAFRDLFSDQVLRAGDEVAIRTISFMFTDLASSSSMFTLVGDARAYQIVREHFALLGGIIREHNGSIVKTIGDGIHAAFNAPDDAFRAAIAIEAAVRQWQTSVEGVDVGVRVGLSTGSSISVNLNDRLDYYGSTVNIAARLESQGKAGQITMSAAFVDDIAVRPLLEDYAFDRRTVTLKGFDEPVVIYQITPG